MEVPKAYLCNRCGRKCITAPNPFDKNIHDISPEMRCILYDRNDSLIPVNVINPSIKFLCKECSVISSSNLTESNFSEKYKNLENRYNQIEKAYKDLLDDEKFYRRQYNKHTRMIGELRDELLKYKTAGLYNRIFKKYD